MAQAVNAVAGRFQMRVGDQGDRHFQARFYAVKVGTLFIEQEGCNIDRHLCVYRGTAVFHGLFLNDAQDVQGGRLGATDMADTAATRAGDVVALAQRRLQALTG